MVAKTDRDAQAALVWKEIRSLQELRRAVLREHNNLFRQHPLITDFGCADADILTACIRQTIKIAQMLGLFDGTVNYTDYL